MSWPSLREASEERLEELDRYFSEQIRTHADRIKRKWFSKERGYVRRELRRRRKYAECDVEAARLFKL